MLGLGRARSRGEKTLVKLPSMERKARTCSRLVANRVALRMTNRTKSGWEEEKENSAMLLSNN